MKIVDGCCLHATETRYFNDSSELRYLADTIIRLIRCRSNLTPTENAVATQLIEWLPHRFEMGMLLFVSCFTTNGSLLSQWRGYTPPGKGCSVGFNPDEIIISAEKQGFRIGKCLYDAEQHEQIANEIIDSIFLAAITYVLPSKHQRHPSQSYHGLFETFESDLISISALIKNPSFREEQEWRIISEPISNYVIPDIKYKEGLSTLVPYLEFRLPSASDRVVSIEHVFIGPTPNINLSMSSASMYLSKYKASPKHGLRYCSIPYRTW